MTRYIDNHEKQLHLIVVRRDSVRFQHAHPTLDGSGTCNVPLDLSHPGSYRVFADSIPEGGKAPTLGTDLHVAGGYEPQPLPPATATTTTTAATVDRYTVTLAGDAKAGRESMLTFSVTRGGKRVTDLLPFLGACGHLVAVRAFDLAYLHVHPAGAPGDTTTTAGPGNAFRTTFAGNGRYRLFLDFKHNNVVPTAQFTLLAGAGVVKPVSPASTVSERPAAPTGDSPREGNAG